MSAKREFTIEKSTDEVFDFTVEVILQNPRATDYAWVDAEVTAIDDADNITDKTSEIIDVTRVSTSGRNITFGLKAGVAGAIYVVKVKGIDAQNQSRSAWGTIIVNNPL